MFVSCDLTLELAFVTSGLMFPEVAVTDDFSVFKVFETEDAFVAVGFAKAVFEVIDLADEIEFDVVVLSHVVVV